MENKNNNSKKKIIITGVILAIILAVIIIVPLRMNKSKNNTNNMQNNIRNNINGGISNEGTASTTQETINYINNSLILNDAQVEEFDTYYNTKVWGLTNIKIKNNGDKSIKQVTVTVYFKDDNGNVIGENNINIGIADLYNTVSALKPNYEWASEKDHYYELKNLTENINPTKNEIKITNVKFAD